jgi:putative tryptophan/tyrosine transport system substrate-binding protein
MVRRFSIGDFRLAIGVAAIFVLAVAFSVVAVPLAADAQQAKRPFRIGMLHTGFFEEVPSVAGLKVGLKALGLEEGRDVTFDIRFTRGKLEDVPSAATSLVKTVPDLLVAQQEYSARALKAATSKIPVVFVEVGDPLAADLVASVPRPGGNVTGVSSLDTELTPKRLEILKATFPGVRRVWAVYHADDLSSAAAARKAQEVAAVLKLEVVGQAVRTREKLVSHLKTLRSGDGLLAPPGLALNISGVILDLELMSKWPALFYNTFWVQAGALVSYGSDLHADGVQAARLVARILRGERPQDLPVEGSNKIELAINLKTARSLGINVPRDILVRADRVIE